MEHIIKIYKYEFKIIIRSLDILVCCPLTGGVIWALRPEKNNLPSKYDLITGSQFPSPKIIYFEEDIKKKCLTLYKKQLKNK
jgi:hypothetical protein